jgi:hypothetical protein
MVQAIYAMPSKQWHPAVPMPEGAVSWMNGVWLPKVRHPRYPATVTQVQHQHLQYQIPGEPFTRATWAADDAYMGHVTRFNAYVPGVPDQSSITRTPEEPPMAEQIVFGRVPKPDNIVDDFVDKPAGRGWANYGIRDRLLAIILHRVLGYAKTTGSYFRNPNEPHGYNALTDWGICGSMDAAIFGAQWDGKIMDWNDPDGRGLYRSPYASGGDGTKSISGDAVAWANKYGVAPAINRYGEAVELSGLSNDAPVSDKMMESIINLVAWRVDKKGRVPYNVWPKNNDGVHMLLSHYELGKVGCHVPDWVFEAVIDGVRARLKTYQVVAVTEPEPTPEPTPTPSPEPASIYPAGMSKELARVLWNGPDGALKVSWSSKPFDFDATRSECLAWLERGAASIPDGGTYADGEWPYLAHVIRRGNRSVHVYQFSDGWTLEKRVRQEEPEQDAA